VSVISSRQVIVHGTRLDVILRLPKDRLPERSVYWQSITIDYCHERNPTWTNTEQISGMSALKPKGGTKLGYRDEE